MRSHLRGEFASILARHIDVHEHCVRMKCLRLGECHAGIVDNLHLEVSDFLEEQFRDSREAAVIVNDENPG